MAAALLAALAGLWRLLFPRLRDERFEDLDEAFAAWEPGFDEDYTDALQESAEVLARSEQRWYASVGKPVEIDSLSIVGQFVDDLSSNEGRGKRPAGMIAANMRRGVWDEVRAWQRDPQRTQEGLQRRLNVWFSRSRAETIASTDTTNLLAFTTREGMTRAGLGFWVWQATEVKPGKLDELVCELCEPLHGRTFSIHDPTPPKHHH